MTFNIVKSNSGKTSKNILVFYTKKSILKIYKYNSFPFDLKIFNLGNVSSKRYNLKYDIIVKVIIWYHFVFFYFIRFNPYKNRYNGSINNTTIIEYLIILLKNIVSDKVFICKNKFIIIIIIRIILMNKFKFLFSLIFSYILSIYFILRILSIIKIIIPKIIPKLNVMYFIKN